MLNNSIQRHNKLARLNKLIKEYPVHIMTDKEVEGKSIHFTESAEQGRLTFEAIKDEIDIMDFCHLGYEEDGEFDYFYQTVHMLDWILYYKDNSYTKSYIDLSGVIARCEYLRNFQDTLKYDFELVRKLVEEDNSRLFTHKRLLLYILENDYNLFNALNIKDPEVSRKILNQVHSILSEREFYEFCSNIETLELNDNVITSIVPFISSSTKDVLKSKLMLKDNNS